MYIYFDIRRESDENGWIDGSRKIENVNELVHKPHTNSSGIWGKRWVTKVNGSKNRKDRHITIHQHWINLTKYNFDSHEVYIQLDKDVREALGVIVSMNKKK